ncbi:MAG TPA: anaerobic glycerol-3-phosphate dehydrogenase subunit GlpC [Spirochaetota bacterium]|nr:anaerobic glycerol-3-phosphate dehydrogenase subunit GlpC [Spirochaetota bacterium]
MIKLENISFDHCIKCTVCTIYCPVARATHLFPGPKQSGPDTERMRIKSPELVDASLKYCTNCKRCEIVCPSDVKIADIIQQARWNYLKKKFRIRDFFLSRTDLVGGMMTRLSAIANFFISLFPVKLMMTLVLKIPYQRVLPRYEQGTFRKRFRSIAAAQRAFDRRVVYFHGCFVNYNNHALGFTLVRVLNAFGIGVEIADEKCCGVPLIANGYIEQAKRNGAYNIAHLSRATRDRELTVVSTSSSCTFALKYEYSHLLELDNSEIFPRTEYITKYVFSLLEEAAAPPLKPVGLRAAYHAPCHLERMGGVPYTIEVLRRIPGLDLVILHSECCGIAGTYGFKSEYYAISQNIGSDLFAMIERAEPEVVITDCETCAMQIAMNTPYRVLHPLDVLAMSLGE